MKVLSYYFSVRLQVFQVPTCVVPTPGACLLLSKTNVVGRPAVPYFLSVNILCIGFKLFGHNLGIKSCWNFLIFVFQYKICFLSEGLVFRTVAGALENIPLLRKKATCLFCVSQ